MPEINSDDLETRTQAFSVRGKASTSSGGDYELAMERRSIRNAIRENMPGINIVGSLQVGFSHIFLAHDGQREIALKFPLLGTIYHEDPVEAELYKNRWETECNIHQELAKATHLVVTPYHTGMCGNFPYLAMQRMHGFTLRDAFDNHDMCQFQDLASIMVEISEPIAIAHRKRIVIRDIKPGNVLFHPQTEIVLGPKFKFQGVRQVKVTDFGMAARIGEMDHDRIFGTPDYMAPEQVLSPGDVDERADVFSMGVLCYEAANGVKPRYIEERLRTGCMRHAEAVANTPPRGFSYPTPEQREFEEITMRALQVEPEKRYRTMGEMHKALKSYYDLTFGKRKSPIIYLANFVRKLTNSI
jgi:serine/threonine protein kinase